jgi:hypothetical protein
MSTSHLNGPEITVLLAALGLILNSAIAVFINAKQRSKRILARDVVRTNRLANACERNFNE